MHQVTDKFVAHARERNAVMYTIIVARGDDTSKNGVSDVGKRAIGKNIQSPLQYRAGLVWFGPRHGSCSKKQAVSVCEPLNGAGLPLRKQTHAALIVGEVTEGG